LVAWALCLAAIGAYISPVCAEVGASGTRIAISGGKPRFYMTYGHAVDAELWAPISTDLRRVGVEIVDQSDTVQVMVRGRKVATWPVVRSRQDVPENGEEPCALKLGGATYLPVRALARWIPLRVDWQERQNLVSLLPASRRASASESAYAPAGGPNLPPAAMLNGVEIESAGPDVIVKVFTNRPVPPRWLEIGAPPARIALDFPNAGWSTGVALPAPTGDIRAWRTGHPSEGVARLTFEVGSKAVKIRSVLVDADRVTVKIGVGKQAGNIQLTAQARAVKQDDTIREALAMRRKGEAGSRLSSRGGLPGPRVERTAPEEQEPGEPIPAPPQRLPVLQVLPANDLSGRIIVVDPGHGGHDNGAEARDGVTREKDLSLKIGLELRDALQARGATVIMTRETDTWVELHSRPNLANAIGADLFISVHCNSTVGRRGTARGVETYWRTPQSVRLAQALHHRALAATGSPDRRIRNRNFCVCREATMPSVLLEVGFIDNGQDLQLLRKADFHRELADSLARGVLDFYGTDIARLPRN
jgi:N-acetylmuramoyl-L-alanine amidase